MKLFALLLALSSLSAAAEERPIAEPLRMAQIKGDIAQFRASDNGHLDSKELCAFEGEAPVYDDLAGTVGKRIQPFTKVCDLNFGGKEMRVQVSAMLYHVKAKGDSPRKKTLQVSLFVFEKANGRMYYSQNAYTSGDLGTQALNLYVAGGTYESEEFPKDYPGFDTTINVVDAQ